MNVERLLLNNKFIRIPKATEVTGKVTLGTLLSNMAYYGFIPSKESVDRLQTLGDEKAQEWWKTIEPELKKATGDDLKMGDFVVYKNFPKEVLEMCEAEYWIRQILMYLGVPNEAVTQPEEAREAIKELPKLKVLHLETISTLDNLLTQLLKLPARWTENQWSEVQFLVFVLSHKFALKDVVFKENLVKLVSFSISSCTPIPLILTSATDVLRLAVGMSNGDISLKTNSKFRNFKRPERKALLDLLSKTSNLEEDLARDTERWKKLLSNLHPFESEKKFPKVAAAYKKLIEKKLHSFNSQVETNLKAGNTLALDLLVQRPGDFVRRLQKVLQVFNVLGADAFIGVLPKLTTLQIIKVNRYLDTINSRQHRTVAPNGNWKKLQVLPNTITIDTGLVEKLNQAIKVELKKRFKAQEPVLLDPNTSKIALQTNDSELTNYGRGTSFPIPPNITFLRSASYWEHKTVGCNWFDNGWNFFDKDWTAKSSCCWITPSGQTGAAFSGDPTNAKDVNGRACQIIDLDIEKLLASGIKYAVWNILSYSKIPFDNAKVFAGLQWGEEPQQGKLFEPSRCQLAFPVTGNGLTKYVAYVDLEKRELVYMDANLKASVQSATNNGTSLSKVMPAFVEYLETLPRVSDVFQHARKGRKKGTVVTYSDEAIAIKDKKEAFVFQPTNKENSFTPLDLGSILNSKGTSKP